MINTLKILCSAAGVNGLDQARQVARDVFAPYLTDMQEDALGNLIGWRRCEKPDAPVVLLEAHLDEIGLVVTGIDERGFLRVDKCGTVDIRTLAAAEVTVHGHKPYPGIFCSTPPHLRKDSKQLPSLDEMAIDVGMDAETAKAAIPVGSPVSFRPKFRQLLGGRVCCKAMDNRAGVAAIWHCLKLLRDQNLPCHVVVVLASQEELGCRGAGAAAFAIQPDVALVVDVSFGYTPDAEQHKCGELGGGPMVCFSPTLDRELSGRLIQLAKEDGMPVQYEVVGGKSGTDADEITTAGRGVKTAVVSVPLRYMHTPAEVVELRDIENTGRLMALFVQQFQQEESR